jgi:antitoxin FitA
VSDTQIAIIRAVKTIQVRNVPDEVHAVLRSRAAAAGVSLSDFALDQLERVATYPPLPEVLARASARSGGASASAIVRAVRAERDAR